MTLLSLCVHSGYSSCLHCRTTQCKQSTAAYLLVSNDHESPNVGLYVISVKCFYLFCLCCVPAAAAACLLTGMERWRRKRSLASQKAAHPTPTPPLMPSGLLRVWIKFGCRSPLPVGPCRYPSDTHTHTPTCYICASDWLFKYEEGH